MSNATTAEELAQRAMDNNVLDESQLRTVWGELGSSTASMADFSQLLLRKNWLTTYQLDRLSRGLRSGFHYGEYKVLYCVGSGTFARVFRAVHRESGKVYAVKVLRSRHSVVPKEAELFRREGELGMSLVHKNIVPTHEVVSRGTEHFIVMDFVEGRNLREAYKIRKQFEPLEAAQITSDIMAGLHYAFQKGISHRDLKMSNVLLSSDGVGMLVDFGLAGFEPEETADGEGANQRTIDYAGLERATNVRKNDPRSDIFFAGCIFYQLVTGVPPFPETRDRSQRLSKTRYNDIKPVAALMPKLPLPLAMAINKAIEFDPARRFQTPGDMLTELKIAIRRTKSGNDQAANKQELASREGIDENGESRKIMVVESDHKRQDVLRDLFKRNGYRALVTSDPERAMDRFRDDPSTADVVLFCSGTIGQSAVEAFNQFGEEAATRKVPAVLLLDEAQKDWASGAATSAMRVVGTMPLTLRKLRQLVVDVVFAEQA